MLPNLGSGLLGLDIHLHHSNSNLHQQQYPNQHMMNFTSDDPTQCVKQSTPKGKQHQPLGFSDEDDQGECKQASPWHRVKWSDAMVRLLILIVYYIGDDGFPEGNDANKKKSGAVLQKKGKWKSVSQAMTEKSYYVSPQQCEDKFNDLNKRYKRITDIVGKGTACKVVENQTLLDTMDHISPRMKEEVRKLLNSKHLFFREMCAYHNSGFGTGAVGGHQSCEAATDFAHQHQQTQQQCFHSPDGGQGANLSNKMVRGGMHEQQDEDEEHEEDEDEEDASEDSEEDEEMQDFGGSRNCVKGHSGRQHADAEVITNFLPEKKQKSALLSSPATSTRIQQLSCELTSVLQDVTKSPWEQRQWMRNRSLQLEEQRVSYQCQAFELEKQRMKWVKFSWKKGRDMERMKLRNEQTRLETERLVLIFRQKELELLDSHQQQGPSNKIPDLYI